ncbi:hypothetical protein [Zhongshania aliphaticivorans]|uniref:hypothetical protein n=1 Tax=Zhongshania aliphaticivorans TaxID=1470434 RepID=UPI0012E54181|nr:hypothetical protein [Zhongshania aliphaticivorans]CAA0119460.1 Uncharacterised protein [Zhongshania aliphaticivorans]
MIYIGLMTRVSTLYILLSLVSFSHALEHSSHNWQLSAPGQKPMVLSISRGLDEPGIIILSADGDNVFKKPINRGELLGACLNKKTHFPSFIMTEVMDGVGLEQAYALSKENTWELITLPSVEGISNPKEITGCYRATSNWHINNEKISCECDFDKLIKPTSVANQWRDVLGDYQTGLYLNTLTAQLSPKKVDDTAQIERLLAQARASKEIIFEEGIKGNQWAIIEHKEGIYGSFSIGILKQNSQWLIWYYVLGNSKSFNAIDDIEHSSGNMLSATLCIEECDWWGRLANVDIRLDTLEFEIIDRE